MTHPRARVPLAAWVFGGLVLLSLPLMLVAKQAWSEPYPSLFQPSFDHLSMRGNTLDDSRYVVHARSSDGAWHRITPERLLDFPSVEDSHGAALSRRLLSRGSLMSTPESAAFLRERLTELGVRDPIQLRVRLFTVRITGADVSTARRTELRREYRIDLQP